MIGPIIPKLYWNRVCVWTIRDSSCVFKMLQEQRVCMKFCAETFKLLKEVYETMSSTLVYEWYGQFKKRLMLVEEKLRKRPGRPSISVNDETEEQISRCYDACEKTWDEKDRCYGNARSGYCIMTMRDHILRFVFESFLLVIIYQSSRNHPTLQLISSYSLG